MKSPGGHQIYGLVDQNFEVLDDGAEAVWKTAQNQTIE